VVTTPALELHGIEREDDPPDTIEVYPTDDVSSLVAGAPEGATFRFNGGTYRGVVIEPKAGMTFLADDHVNLIGSVPVDGFTEAGGRWVAPAPISMDSEPVQGPDWGYCDDDRPACVYREELFFDGVALIRVDDLASVDAGTWFFDPTGSIVAGSNPIGADVEISTAPYAFHGDADNVTVAGFVIERYATPGRQGVINPRIGRIGPAGLNWTVYSNVLRSNHGWGVKLESGMVVRSNLIESNGQGGIGGVATDVVIERNHIVENCTAGFRCFGWEGGGLKLETDDIVIRENVVERNLGHGIHTDRGSDRVVIAGNIVSANQGAGIHHEISGDAEIVDNIVIQNGFAPDERPSEPGILVLGSWNTLVERNQLSGNALGIVLRQDDRWDQGILQKVTVRNNEITTFTGPAAVMGGDAGAGFSGTWGADVVFEGNAYTFEFDVDDEAPFRWEGLPVGIEGWQELGNDVSGTFDTG
jgi:parallel beta-helix repeat protein